jgi:prophage tail gpP-like protein
MLSMTENPTELEIYIDGDQITAYHALSIHRTLDMLCGEAEISLLSDENNFGSLKSGAEVRIIYNRTPIFTGYLDYYQTHLSPESDQLLVKARDKTIDLVECPVLGRELGFKSVTLPQMAEALASKFSITVKNALELPKVFSPWYIFYGETVFSCLDRAAKIEGSLLITEGDGTLLVDRPRIKTNSFISLQEGVNILDVALDHSSSLLFSDYQVRTYSQNLGNLTALKDHVTENRVTRYRPFIIDAEGMTSLELAKKRALWERNLRRARSEIIRVTIPDWTSKNILFSLNSLVDIKVPSHRIQGVYLISGLNFQLSDAHGFTTELTLIDSSAYFPDPTAEIRMNQVLDLLRKDQAEP